MKFLALLLIISFAGCVNCKKERAFIEELKNDSWGNFSKCQGNGYCGMSLDDFRNQALKAEKFLGISRGCE